MLTFTMRYLQLQSFRQDALQKIGIDALITPTLTYRALRAVWDGMEPGSALSIAQAVRLI